MIANTTDTIVNDVSRAPQVGHRLLEVSHRLVQRAFEERVQFLLQDVPGLLRDEAERIVREGIEFDALEGRLNEKLVCDSWGKVRHSPLDRRRAIEAVEQRLIMPHIEEVDRIYAQACRDLEAIDLDFDALDSYRRRRIFDQFRRTDTQGS
jgi:hypothetical protein